MHLWNINEIGLFGPICERRFMRSRLGAQTYQQPENCPHASVSCLQKTPVKWGVCLSVSRPVHRTDRPARPGLGLAGRGPCRSARAEMRVWRGGFPPRHTACCHQRAIRNRTDAGECHARVQSDWRPVSRSALHNVHYPLPDCFRVPVPRRGWHWRHC